MTHSRVNFLKKLRERSFGEGGLVALLFGFEGFIVQLVTSIHNCTTNIYASYLGASDTQLGMISMVINLVTLIALLPVGMIANRMKSSKNLLVFLSLFMGVAYIGLAIVPALAKNKMIFYFLFIGLAIGSLNTYNAQWQTFFGDVVMPVQRNDVYIVRNKFMMFMGIVAPMLFGCIMGTAELTEEKLFVLRVFFLIDALFLIIQAVLLSRIKGGERSPELIAQMQSFSVKKFGYVFKEQMLKNKVFMSFFGAAILFYFGWCLDWGLFYISQTQYCGFDASTIGYYNAIACLVQLFSLTFWSKRNGRYGYGNTMMFASFGLTIGPLCVLSSLFAPPNLQVPIFIIVGSFIAFPQAGMTMCLVQLLLESAPALNRPIIVSIYTMVITFISCVVPLLGVQLYLLFGGNRSALLIIWPIIIAIRGCATIAFIVRYRYFKHKKIQEENL